MVHGVARFDRIRFNEAIVDQITAGSGQDRPLSRFKLRIGCRICGSGVAWAEHHRAQQKEIDQRQKQEKINFA